VNLQFRSVPGPPASLIERVAACDPTNPFYTPEYATANQSLGAQACFLGLCAENEVVSGCVAFLSGSFLRRCLKLPSLPNVSDPPAFWRGVLKTCRELRVWNLQIESYASQVGEIPPLPGELTRRDRVEYVLDLGRENVLDGISSQHRRNISRASKAGLSIRRTRAQSACAQHRELMDSSLERRANRGEKVHLLEVATPLALLASQSGEIFQAVDGDRVLSSVLVLRSSQGAYYQSAGTLPDGMKLGASPFLISQMASILKQEGVQVFNLGGAGKGSPGLQRFKAGFNAREIALQAATFCPKSVTERKFHTALRSCWAWVRQNSFGGRGR
jgi:hypothetical protein